MHGYRPKSIINDIGIFDILLSISILLSDDSVGINQVTLNLTKDKNGKNFCEISILNLDANIQLKHAEEIGISSRKYKLIKL